MGGTRTIQAQRPEASTRCLKCWNSRERSTPRFCQSGWGPISIAQGLERLADISGGAAYFPSDASQLHAQFTRTVENLRRRYVLGYTSTHIARDGSWRKVEIKSRSANHVIRSRSGYFAPDR